MGIVAVDEKLAADGEQLGASRLIVPKKPPVEPSIHSHSKVQFGHCEFAY